MPWDLPVTSFLGGRHWGPSAKWPPEGSFVRVTGKDASRESGNGLNLGAFPGIEVRRTKEHPTDPQSKHLLFMLASEVDIYRGLADSQ